MTAAGEQDRPDGVTSVWRAVARYTALRLLLFLAVYLAARLFIDEPVLALGAGVLGSAILSVSLLAKQRSELNRATAARAERRKAEREQRRARLDEA